MFEKVLSKNAINVVGNLAVVTSDFYLAGGTGLALQIGHRKSEDLDLFSGKLFFPEELQAELPGASVSMARKGTIHCEIDKVKISFLYYKQKLVFPLLRWHGLNLADWRDITAEKFKTIAQRGSRKDFYDLYAVLKTKLTLKDACDIFKMRFALSGISMYHVLRGLTYFEDADKEVKPVLLKRGKEWEWKSVKKFFTRNIKEFQKELLPLDK